MGGILMEMQPKVSVIVSVYNTEKYLRQCLESLVIQTLNEIEIIVINNGCLDHSQEIIDEYAQKYPQKIVKISLKENKGLGFARNLGIEVAGGEYIGFLDSDDLADSKMFETMYNAAKKGHDIVICDYSEIRDNGEISHVTTGFRGETFNKKEVIKYSTETAFAWNKLYKRSLFDKLKFLLTWYEDVGTTPILLSYAQSIYYVKTPLVYYRQRAGSTIYSQDSRTLGVINSWRRILKKANKSYFNEAVFSVARSINIFINFKPEYSEEFLNFAQKYKKHIKNNSYYRKSVESNEIRDLYRIKIIPKKIHYCWFGGHEKDELIQKCIQSWREKLSDFEIIEWNETNCNMEENEYIKQAYKAKKWAFVSDYFRLKALYEHGGIYLDTDVEITGDMHKYRTNKAFFAFETPEVIQTGVIGSIKGAYIIKRILKTYRNENFIKSDGTYNDEPNVFRVTNILVNNYNLELSGKKQILREISIYPANELTIDVGDGNNRAIHHFNISWWDDKNRPSWKQVVLEKFLATRENT